MSQIIQITKETILNNPIALRTGYIKNPFSTITAMDVIGLAWIFKDEDILEDLK
ncbi:MAG: hypothetical protein ACW9W3_05085 [Candidatus Nitrosopumilus sp. bin_68KS]